jgi:uncharacterized protein (DUF4415 family)
MGARYEKMRGVVSLTREQARRMARAAIERMTDEEDAAITAAALSDPDNLPLTPKQLAQFRPMAEVRPELLRKLRGQRGPQKSKPVKTRVALRLDPDVVEYFKKRGPGWQSRINEALRKVAKLPKEAKLPKVAKRSR